MDPTSNIVELIKLAWAAIGPLVGWFVGRSSIRRQIKRRKEAIIRDLSGLPIECKAILIYFYDQHTHTLRTDPSSPPMLVLIQRGIARRGPGGGTYKAVDCYVSISSDIWEAMDDWVISDPDIIAIRENALQSRQ